MIQWFSQDEYMTALLLLYNTQEEHFNLFKNKLLTPDGKELKRQFYTK